ncbi:armadillo-type protein [Boletus edulis]|nr:armadillo-type protein [Boletus edulis]
MFKGILPSKRLPSTEFTMITSLDDISNGKENVPDPVSVVPAKPQKMTVQKDRVKHGKSKSVKALQDFTVEVEPVVTNQAFDKLLDDLQIPSTLRPKLANMDATVKVAMLKSSQVMTANPSTAAPFTPRTMRKARSIESMTSPLSTMGSESQPRRGGLWGSAFAGKSTTDLRAMDNSDPSHERGASFDAAQTLSRARAPVTPVELVSSKSKEKALGKGMTPVKLCSILTSTSSTILDVEVVKKLRLLLRNEAASWTEDFLRSGGYGALLTRLNEILEVEWREEQHDDQMLHELLRCFKALSTSSIGCFALRSSCPTPFVQLISLLYSDKKPGDVATRQLITELLLILFEVYPASSLPSSGGRLRREAWESSASSSNVVTLPVPHKNFFSLIRALLLTPAPPPTESPACPVSPHAFIESLHHPRIYKSYLQELSDLCRDYFWVFCHPNNTIWNLSEVDEGKVEKPKAPGGMTGGVEFEAMGYFTTHFKLMNAISNSVHDLNLSSEHEMSAHRFHMDLFASGLERIILICRKASTAYYPTLHLELSRYIQWTILAKFELPWTVSRLIGPPPIALCKLRPTKSSKGDGHSPHNTPTKKRVAQPPGIIGLPPTNRMEPIKFE